MQPVIGCCPRQTWPSRFSQCPTACILPSRCRWTIDTNDRDPRHLGLLSRQRRGAGRRRPNRRGGAGRALHAQEARSAASRRRPSSTACARRDCRPDDLDYVAFYEKPLRKFERLLETYLAFAPAGFPQLLAWPCRCGSRTSCTFGRTIRKALGRRKRTPLVFTDHHESHAASAFFPSPFDEAAILTLDGVGEWSTTTMASGAATASR